MISYNLKTKTLIKKSQFAIKTSTVRRFLIAMSSAHKAWLDGDADGGEFLTIEPRNGRLYKLLSDHTEDSLSQYFDRIVTELLHDLVLYGRAYLLINPQYVSKTNEEGKKYNELCSLDIGTVSGFIKKQSEKTYEFCALSKFDYTVHDSTISKEQLVMFDLKDLGYKRSYFYHLIKIINKYDVTSIPSNLHLCRGYNFTEHCKAVKLKRLKALKSVGWVDDTYDLLNSYKLYNQIRLNKLGIRLFDYVVRRINEGLIDFMKDDKAGLLVPRVRSIDYDKCWRDYSDGKLSYDQLRDFVY